MGLKLIMAVSQDDFLGTGPDDDMSWTGPADKAVFRLLTAGNRGICGVGRKTWELMPELPGRTLVPLSRRPGRYIAKLPRIAADPLSYLSENMECTVTASTAPLESLGSFYHANPHAWLIGGPTIAMEALNCALVDEVYLCRNMMRLQDGIPDRISPWLMSRGERQNAGVPWRRVQRINFDSVKVDVWRGPSVERSQPRV